MHDKVSALSLGVAFESVGGPCGLTPWLKAGEYRTLQIRAHRAASGLPLRPDCLATRGALHRLIYELLLPSRLELDARVVTYHPARDWRPAAAAAAAGRVSGVSSRASLWGVWRDAGSSARCRSDSALGIRFVRTVSDSVRAAWSLGRSASHTRFRSALLPTVPVHRYRVSFVTLHAVCHWFWL